MKTLIFVGLVCVAIYASSNFIKTTNTLTQHNKALENAIAQMER